MNHLKIFFLWNSVPSHSFPELSFLLHVMRMIPKFFLGLSLYNCRAVFCLMSNSQNALHSFRRSWVMFLTGNAKRTKTMWHHICTNLLLRSIYAHFLTLASMHHPWFPHHEDTHSIQHGERDWYYASTLEIIGGQSGRKSSFSQETEETFSPGRERMHYDHGSDQAFTLLPPSPREVKVLQSLWWWAKTVVLYCRTRSNEAKEMKDRVKGGQAALRWIGYYPREEARHYLSRQNSHWLLNADGTLESHWTAWYHLVNFGETRLRDSFLPYTSLLKVSWTWGWPFIRRRWHAVISKVRCETWW